MFLLFYLTHPDEATARRIGQQLVQERLAACANYFPIQSMYWWEGQVAAEGEWVSLLKTATKRGEALEKRAEELHPYEVPCILQVTVKANEAYEKWIEESTMEV